LQIFPYLLLQYELHQLFHYIIPYSLKRIKQQSFRIRVLRIYELQKHLFQDIHLQILNKHNQRKEQVFSFSILLQFSTILLLLDQHLLDCEHRHVTIQLIPFLPYLNNLMWLYNWILWFKGKSMDNRIDLGQNFQWRNCDCSKLVLKRRHLLECVSW
jgi:hypothetical protein